MRVFLTRATLATTAALMVMVFGTAGAQAQMICDNSCASAFDNECDDGGPGSLYNVCGYGTDCNDCGARYVQGGAPPAPAGQICTNTCSSAFDQECDDGGPGSLYNICAYGTDCNDCGARYTQGQVAPPPPAPAGYLCMNTCSSSNDMECDDGGPGSLYNICAYGSDCNDCGPRPPMAAPTPVAPTGYICMNTCGSSNDQECDDGGPGSLYNICGYGTDCNDCGPRPPMAAPVVPPGYICQNTCSTSNDMECDDGGPGSLYNICAYGSDCNDCGARPPMAAPVVPPGYICMNTCSTANDQECDDGGPASLYNICAYGSDCNDCGARPPMAAPVPTPMPPAPVAPTLPPGYLCDNSCSSAFDMECDDGGPGSLYNICLYGSDCNDCGARPPMAAPVPTQVPVPVPVPTPVPVPVPVPTTPELPPPPTSLSLTCDTAGNELAGEPGAMVSVMCPGGCTYGAVWGTAVYTDDSSVCAAAVHSGVITPGGGPFTVQIAPGQPSYPGSFANGITTSTWGQWHRSFMVMP